MDAASKKNLKAQAHALKPVVIIGKAGLTEAVLAEVELALDSHELIKVKIRAEKAERKVITEAMCEQTGAALVQAIGLIAVIFRAKPQKPASVKPRKTIKPKRLTNSDSRPRQKTSFGRRHRSRNSHQE